MKCLKFGGLHTESSFFSAGYEGIALHGGDGDDDDDCTVNIS